MRKFFKCPKCGKKGARLLNYYLGNVPPYGWMSCRYCGHSWETSDPEHVPALEMTVLWRVQARES